MEAKGELKNCAMNLACQERELTPSFQNSLVWKSKLQFSLAGQPEEIVLKVQRLTCSQPH